MISTTPFLIIYAAFVIAWILSASCMRRKLSVGQWVSTILDACVTGILVILLSMGVWTAYTLRLNFFGTGSMGLWCALAIMIAWAIVNLREMGKRERMENTFPSAHPRP